MDLVFEWDRRKAKANLAKHGVSFEEATRAFFDPLARIFDDPDHSLSESREILVGHSDPSKLLVVCFVQRDPVVRLFSARRATSRERHDYEEAR
jgi:uncharacterized DUF497 family protein